MRSTWRPKGRGLHNIMHETSQTNRRELLAQTALQAAGLATGLSSSSVLAGQPSATKPGSRPRVAAIFTEFRFRSHAFNFLENFLRPYLFCGKLVDPGVDVVSFYADQFPDGDMAREVSRRFQIPLFASIDEALCLGGKELAVDAVLSIVEHGEYPTNDRGQKMYPRKEFFDAAVAVMRRSRRFVPFFNDKHLAYRWDWAEEMYCTARQCGIPLMAGSSVPLAERRPPLKIPAGAKLEEAVSIHGGGVESYDFHGLEVLQSVIESRSGGETGIACIEFLEGDALWRAADQGRWSRELADAAMAAELGIAPREQPPKASHGLLITYNDGLRATVLKVGSSSNRWNFACRLRGERNIHAVRFLNGPWGNRNLFKALSHAVQSLIINRRSPYPVERTLLVTGALDAAMTSRELGGAAVSTPQLQFCYHPTDFRSFRENGESWKVITSETPEKKTFEPGDS